MRPVSCTNTHHDVKIWQIMGWLKIQTLEYLENGTFLRNKKVLKLCLRQHILRTYSFVMEVTYNNISTRDITDNKIF